MEEAHNSDACPCQQCQAKKLFRLQHKKGKKRVNYRMIAFLVTLLLVGLLCFNIATTEMTHNEQPYDPYAILDIAVGSSEEVIKKRFRN